MCNNRYIELDSTLYVQLLFHLCTLSFSAAVQLQPPRDPLLQLVFLQEASGYWRLDPALATALGKTSKEMKKSKPEKVGFCQFQSLQKVMICMLIKFYGTKYRKKLQILNIT